MCTFKHMSASFRQAGYEDFFSMSLSLLLWICSVIRESYLRHAVHFSLEFIYFPSVHTKMQTSGDD